MEDLISNNNYNKIFKFSDPEKLRIATEWYENGYSIVTSWEMGSIEYDLDLYRENLKSAEDELKEVEYNMYKTVPMFDSLENFKDGKKIEKLFQMENDKILAESINDHETAMFLQEETDRVLAESINNLEKAMSLQERENNNLKINEKKLSMSEMTNLLKNSTLGDYLVKTNNKQKRKKKKRKKKRKDKFNIHLIK